jgi:hypothetical protein
MAKRKGLQFEYEPTRSVKPRKVRTSFDVRVRFKFETKGFDDAQKKLANALDPTFMQHVLRKAVVRSIVWNIRYRFLQSMERALEMEVLQEDEKENLEGPRKRMRDKVLKDQLNDAMDALNEANLHGHVDVAEAQRERIDRIGEQLKERLAMDPLGRPMQSHKFSTMTGNLFRASMLAVLGVLTDESFVGSWSEGSSVGVGVGRFDFLDMIETPSASYALTGTPTTSRYKTLWRHLEFGTGEHRRAQKDHANEAVAPPARWFFGRRRRANLWLKGTMPMNFLTDDAGQPYLEDENALVWQLISEMDLVLN